MMTRTLGLVLATLVTLTPWVETAAPQTRIAATPSYVVEPPDILELEVSGLPAKAKAVRGEYLVRPDGTIGLGTYGPVMVDGLTLDDTRAAIARHLAPHAAKKGVLQVRASVTSINSKFYYVIANTEDGEHVYKYPAVGGDTVVSAVLKVAGLAATATKGRVWVARASGKNVEVVDWRSITQEGRSATNVLLETGDRVYVADKPK